jgi:hypothetical protein
MNDERKMDEPLNGKDITKKGKRNKFTKNGENKLKRNFFFQLMCHLSYFFFLVCLFCRLDLLLST